MIKVVLSAMLIIANFMSFAQEGKFNKADVDKELAAKVATEKPDSLKKWKVGSLFNVNFTNTSLNNWAAGGQNAQTISSLFTSYANLLEDHHSWNNYIELGYGQSKLGSANFRKGDDKIILTSKYGRNLSKKTSITALVDFRTQFDKGSKFEIDKATGSEKETYISNFLAPAYFVGSLGFQIKPNEKFFIVLSPVTTKTTIVNSEILSNAGAYGVSVGKKSRIELGAYTNIGAKFSIAKNVTYQANANLFMNYKTLNKIDVFFDNLISMKVNNFIVTTFNYTLLYDDDIKTNKNDGTIIGPKLQRKSVLTVGLNFKLL